MVVGYHFRKPHILAVSDAIKICQSLSQLSSSQDTAPPRKMASLYSLNVPSLAVDLEAFPGPQMMDNDWECWRCTIRNSTGRERETYIINYYRYTQKSAIFARVVVSFPKLRFSVTQQAVKQNVSSKHFSNEPS